MTSPSATRPPRTTPRSSGSPSSTPRHVPAGTVLAAAVDGDVWAAVSIEHGDAVADPFRPTGELVSLLHERARQLRRRPRGARTSRRSAGRCASRPGSDPTSPPPATSDARRAPRRASGCRSSRWPKRMVPRRVQSGRTGIHSMGGTVTRGAVVLATVLALIAPAAASASSKPGVDVPEQSPT